MKYDLPTIRGSYRFDAPLAKTNWFGVGGHADVLFKPEDAADLAEFLKQVHAGAVVPSPSRGGLGRGALDSAPNEAPPSQPPPQGGRSARARVISST